MRARAPLFIALAVLVIAALGGGGYFAYQKGWVGDRQGVVAEALSKALEKAGLEGITVEVDREWTATISGRATTPDKSEMAEEIVSESEDVAEVENDVDVVPDAKALLAAVASEWEKDLLKRGATRTGNADGTVTWSFGRGKVEIGPSSVTYFENDGGPAEDDTRSVTVIGDDSLQIIERDGDQPELTLTATIDVGGTLTLTGEGDRNSSNLFRRLPGVRSVVDKTTRSAAFRKREFDAALQAAGLPGVAAEIAEDDAIVLTGGVPNPAERDRAQAVVVARAGESAVIRNEIQIRQTTLSAPSFGTSAPPGSSAFPQQAPQASAGVPRARLSGLWIGQAKGTLLSYLVNLRLVDAGVGEIAGESIYALDNQVICRGQLAVAQFDGSSATLQDDLTQVSNVACNFGGAITLKHQNDGTIYAEWMSKNRAGKVAYKAVLRRQR